VRKECASSDRSSGSTRSGSSIYRDDKLFDFRTMAERVNARLKDEFGARFVRVRGAVKVKCHLMFGVLVLAVDQILRVCAFRTEPA
jgi:hypothetical protein